MQQLSKSTTNLNKQPQQNIKKPPIVIKPTLIKPSASSSSISTQLTLKRSNTLVQISNTSDEPDNDDDDDVFDDSERKFSSLPIQQQIDCHKSRQQLQQLQLALVDPTSVSRDLFVF
jgi:hypothetical protein